MNALFFSFFFSRTPRAFEMKKTPTLTFIHLKILFCTPFVSFLLHSYGLAIGFSVLAGAACCGRISGGFFKSVFLLSKITPTRLLFSFKRERLTLLLLLLCVCFFLACVCRHSALRSQSVAVCCPTVCRVVPVPVLTLTFIYSLLSSAQ